MLSADRRAAIRESAEMWAELNGYNARCGGDDRPCQLAENLLAVLDDLALAETQAQVLAERQARMEENCPPCADDSDWEECPVAFDVEFCTDELAGACWLRWAEAEARRRLAAAEEGGEL